MTLIRTVRPPPPSHSQTAPSAGGAKANGAASALAPAGGGPIERADSALDREVLDMFGFGEQKLANFFGGALRAPTMTTDVFENAEGLNFS